MLARGSLSCCIGNQRVPKPPNLFGPLVATKQSPVIFCTCFGRDELCSYRDVRVTLLQVRTRPASSPSFLFDCDCSLTQSHLLSFSIITEKRRMTCELCVPCSDQPVFRSVWRLGPWFSPYRFDGSDDGSVYD